LEITLFDFKSGKKATIKYLKEREAFHTKLTLLNIRTGKVIKKITAQPFHCPVVI